jgi:Raf kinase inhibitor-like YbhB/YbcL family protein
VLVAEFKLSSDDLASGSFPAAHILSEAYGFGCSGGNQSPHLAWQEPPDGTKSFVITLYDPDAPTGIGWTHWVVANIPADVRALARGAGNDGGKLPAGAVQTRTDFGVPGYGGPCPPRGPAHRYVFTVTALKVDRLDVGPDAMPALVGFFTRANSLAQASFTVPYGR